MRSSIGEHMFACRPTASRDVQHDDADLEIIRARDGTEPVKAFIDTLQPQAQAAVQRHIRRLNMLGEDLDYPFTSQVDGELRELRAWSGNRHFRIYYRRSGSFAVLLHAIEKRTRALPLADTAVARARYDDFKRRIDAQPRVPPRPLGSDAR